MGDDVAPTFLNEGRGAVVVGAVVLQLASEAPLVNGWGSAVTVVGASSPKPR